VAREGEGGARRGAAGDRGRLLISCADRPGIVAAVAGSLHRLGANIVRSDQHTTDPSGGTFFMRVEFDLPGLLPRRAEVEAAFAEVAAAFSMRWRLATALPLPRVGLMVSREGHCLQELLWRWQLGELPCRLTAVVSNHPDLGEAVAAFGVPFHHVPVPRDPEGRHRAEERQAQLLGEPELVVLARYMQILSPAFVARFPGRIINIHHSFLPAFVGGRPYEQAYTRGVKIIGATAHYVTAELDAGPIIEQDVQRVTHRDAVADMRRVGREIERAVLARAVLWHLEDRILLHGQRTVVFH
jgi:formyltetrahydrofolate deformylase